MIKYWLCMALRVWFAGFSFVKFEIWVQGDKMTPFPCIVSVGDGVPCSLLRKFRLLTYTLKHQKHVGKLGPVFKKISIKC